MSIAKAHIEQIAELISAMCQMANRKADVLFDARHTWSWCGKEMPEEQDSVGIYVEDLGLVLEEMRTFINSLLGPRADAFWCISDTNSNFLLDITELDYYTPLFQDDFSKIYSKLLAMKYVCVNFTLDGDDSRIQRDLGAKGCWDDVFEEDFYATPEVTQGADSNPYNFDELLPISKSYVPQSLALKGVFHRQMYGFTETPSGTWYDRMGVTQGFLGDRSPALKEGSLIPVGGNPDGTIKKVVLAKFSYANGQTPPDWVHYHPDMTGGYIDVTYKVDGVDTEELSEQDLIDIFTSHGDEVPISVEMASDPGIEGPPTHDVYGYLRKRFAPGELQNEEPYDSDKPYWYGKEFPESLQLEDPAITYDCGDKHIWYLGGAVKFGAHLPGWWPYLDVSEDPTTYHAWGWSASGGWVDFRWVVGTPEHPAGDPIWLTKPGSYWRVEGGWVPTYWPSDMEMRLFNYRISTGWCVGGGIWQATIIKEVE